MREQAVQFIREQSRDHEILVLAPTVEAARDLLRSACDRALIGVHASSLQQYARELTRSGPTPINNIVYRAICTRIAHTAELDYLAPVAKMPGFPKALARTIRELRMHGARPNGDLGNLLAAYERELQDRGLADEAAMYHLASSSEAARIPTLTYAVEAKWNAEQRFLDWLMPSLTLHPSAPDCPNNALQAVQRDLFSEGFPEPRPADASFTVFAASTESQECVELARLILARIRDGARFDECGILLRQPERYGPLLAEAFRRARIPLWFARGTREPDVAGRALIVLLQCAQEGLSASRIGEYLSLQQVPEMNPAGWERIVTNAHVIGGAERWYRRLHAVARDSEALEELKHFVLPLIDRLHKLPEQALWGEWLDILRALTESAVDKNSDVIDSLDELAPMRDIGPVGIEEVTLLLSDHLRSSRARNDEHRYGCVWAGSIEEAHGFNFQHVFVPGVAEGAFPRPRREDPLLLDEQRRELGMREATEHEEQQLLRDAALCATESLTLSYGRIDLETGRPRVPSLYLYAALRAAGGETEIRTSSWPGADAVDDFEYDTIALATKVPGCGAYLKKANTRLYEALISRYRRWDRDARWHSADGLNLIDSTLEDYRLTERAYSVSALEAYAACPYQFFLRAMLRLQPIERPESLQRMDPGTRGSVFHHIQLGVLRELKRASLLPVTQDNVDQTLTLLDRTIDRIGSEEAERLAPAVTQVWDEELRRMRIDLRGWITKMATDDSAWTPIAFELAFGRRRDDAHDERSVENPVRILDRYLLQGSVDMVERHVSGHFRVTDHKTGSYPQPVPRTIGKGEVLQPALYALAVEQILGEPISSARLYYATLRANFRSVPVTVPNQYTGRVLDAIDHAIGQGLLPANPREDACEQCNYRCVCGPYEEQRVKRKPKDSTLEFIRKCE